MDILDAAQKEFWKAPLAFGIGIVALLIAVFGSPFDEGGFLNPEAPNVAVIEEFTSPNTHAFPGRFSTTLATKNLGRVTASVRGNIYLLDNEMKALDILNDPGEARPFEMPSGTMKLLVSTTDIIPTHIVVCLESQSLTSSATSDFQGAYSLPGAPKHEDEVISFINANKSDFENEIARCIRSIE